MKDKNHIIISKKGKVFEKNQHSLMIKTHNKIGIVGTYPNIIKAIYDKSIANITLSGERLKSFLLRLGTRQGCLLCHFYST